MGGKGSGGHNRKSDSQKVLEGDRGKRLVRQRPTKVRGTKKVIPASAPAAKPPTAAKTKKPACPVWLSPEAKRIWKDVSRTLEESGTLGSVDRHILATYCSACAQRRAAEEALLKPLPDKDGNTVEPAAGRPYVFTQPARHGQTLRPEFKILEITSRLILAYGTVLGLTPKTHTPGTPAAPAAPGTPSGNVPPLPEDDMEATMRDVETDMASRHK